MGPHSLDEDLFFEYSDPEEGGDYDIDECATEEEESDSMLRECTTLPRSQRFPIQTERTISLSSASVPESGGLLAAFTRPFQASFAYNPRIFTDSTEQEEVDHTLTSSSSTQSVNISSDLSSPSPQTRSESLTERDQLYLINTDDQGAVDNANEIAGSLPSSKILGRVPDRGGYPSFCNSTFNDDSLPTQRRRSDQRYITVNTLSFRHFLSPETPFLLLGNPEEATLRLLISVGVHGDEPCGMQAFNELLQNDFFDLLPSHVSVVGLVGNPGAISVNQRFLEHNLNRMMREDLFEGESYEAERARVLGQAIARCDILLDLHSCSARSPAHALPMDGEKSTSLARKMPVAFVIQHLAHTTKGRATTVDYAQRLGGKVALCVECGQHTDRSSIDTAKKCIQKLIEITTKGEEAASVWEEAPIVLSSVENEPVRKKFRFCRQVKAFDFVPFGEVIAEDIEGPIVSKYPKGTYIVMPTRNPVLGEEAFFYASQVGEGPIQIG